MSTFKEYIRECVAKNENICVKEEHFGSVTFEDVCMLIHIITTTHNQVVMDNDASAKINCADMVMNHHIQFDKLNYKESLAILAVIAICKVDYLYPIIMHTGADDIYHMSDEFVKVAKYCGVYDYPVTKNIISRFRINYEYSTEEADGYLDHYLNGQTKSAGTSKIFN